MTVENPTAMKVRLRGCTILPDRQTGLLIKFRLQEAKNTVANSGRTYCGEWNGSNYEEL